MRSLTAKRYYLLIGVLLAGFLLLPVSSSSQSETEKSEFLSEEEIRQELDHWFESPLKYITLPDEESILKKLKTLEEKIQFVRIFWARREYNPEIEINEFREEFYSRVAYANAHFGRREEGWKTARGEIYIVFGPPSRVEMQSISGTARPAILWYYDESPSVHISPFEPLIFADIFRNSKYYLVNRSLSGLRPYPRHRFISEKIPFEFRPALKDANERTILNKKITYTQITSPAPSTTPQLPSRQIPFQWQADYITLAEQKVELLLTIKFKYRDLAWYKEEDRLQVQLTLQAKLKDQEGEVIDQKTDTIDLSLTADQLKEKIEEEYHYQMSLIGRPGSHLLEIIVKDNLSGGVSQLKEAIDIPPSL